MKVDNCPCSCRRAQKYVATIELQVTYDTSVITAVRKANARLVHDNRKTEARFLRILHVASGNPFFKEICTWLLRLACQNVRLSCVALTVFSIQFLTLRLATVATIGKTCNTRTITKHIRQVVTGFNKRTVKFTDEKEMAYCPGNVCLM